MSLSLSIATYFICWWMALFMVLPFGVKTQAEEGDIVPGSVESAPHKAQILKKMMITSIVALFLFAMVFVTVTYDLINYEHLPFLPNFQSVTGQNGTIGLITIKLS